MFCHAPCTCGRAFSCQCSDAHANSGHRLALGGPHSLPNARCRTYSKNPTDGHVAVFSPLRYSRRTSKPCGMSGCCSHRCSVLGGRGPAQDASRFERGFTSLRMPARSFKSRIYQVESRSFPFSGWPSLTPAPVAGARPPGPAHSSTPGTRPPPCPPAPAGGHAGAGPVSCAEPGARSRSHASEGKGQERPVPLPEGAGCRPRAWEVGAGGRG